MSGNLFYLFFQPSITITCACYLFGIHPAAGAEKIVIRYGALSSSVAVEELSEFAETGKLSSSLQVYFRSSRQNPKIIRRYLTRRVQMSPVFLDRVLNNEVGELVLDRFSEIIHTRSRKADRKALRSALVLSASDDQQVTPIEIIQKYPTPELEIEGKKIRHIYFQLHRLQSRFKNLFDFLVR